MVRLLIVSEVSLFREGLVRILAEVATWVIVRTTGSARAIDDQERAPADIVLLDLALDDALGLARTIADRFRGVRMIGLGVSEEPGNVLRCAEAGIIGYLARDATPADLVEVIRCARAGELRCSRHVAGALIERVASYGGMNGASAPRLTPRESQIVRLLDQGLTNKEIAAQLRISSATARNHVHSILEKLGARTRGQAAAVVRRALAGN